MIRGLKSGRVKALSLFSPNIQSESGAHTASYSTVTAVPFRE
jgi:hypothetical protein